MMVPCELMSTQTLTSLCNYHLLPSRSCNYCWITIIRVIASASASCENENHNQEVIFCLLELWNSLAAQDQGGKRGEREERNPRNYTPNDWKHVKTVKCENSWADTVWCLQLPSDPWPRVKCPLTPGLSLVTRSPCWPLIGWYGSPLSQTRGSCNMHQVTWHGNIAWEKHLIAFCRHITPALSSCHLSVLSLHQMSVDVTLCVYCLPCVIRGKCLLNTGSWEG